MFRSTFIMEGLKWLTFVLVSAVLYWNLSTTFPFFGTGEAGMRPLESFNGFIGQTKAVESIMIELCGSAKAGKVPEGFLLTGNPGLGKTEMAKAIAIQNKTAFHTVRFVTRTEIAKVLSKVEKGDIVFVDEGHRVRHEFYELLFPCIERKGLTLSDILGKEKEIEGIDSKKQIQDFIFIIATDQPGSLPNALKTRLKDHILDFYSERELRTIISNWFDSENKKVPMDESGMPKKEALVEFTPHVLTVIARTGKGNPRQALRHAKTVRHAALAAGMNSINAPFCKSCLKKNDISKNRP